MAEELFNETFVLSGLRHHRTRMIELYRRLNMTLEDSDTYQWILEQGEAKGLAKGKVQSSCHHVLVLGEKRFGPPPAPIAQAIQAITDLDRLERLFNRAFDATSWDDLLATP
jgi:predicted transposase YdaD